MAQVHENSTKIVNNYTIFLIGDSAVGKTSIFNRLTENLFKNQTHIPTIGIEHGFKIVNGPKMERIRLTIYDAAGLEKFRQIGVSHYSKADAFLIVYDITDAKSFQNVGNHVEEIRKFTNFGYNFWLVGNKVDCSGNRKVAVAEAENLAAGIAAQFIEISAKTDQNVDVLLANVLENLNEKRQKLVEQKDVIITTEVCKQRNWLICACR